MPANKIPKWKRDHEAFQAALSRGRKVTQAEKNGTLSSLEPAREEYDDRVQCPHCTRKFSALAAERHIPKCTSIQAKPKTLVRGGGNGLLAKPPNARASHGNMKQYVL